jgi:hypothetical protein
MSSSTTLKLYLGSPSPLSLGAPNTEPLPIPVPEVINLAEGTFSVQGAAGSNAWSPAFANIKDGGVWSSSSASEGRQLMLGPDGNVIETITLYSSAGDASARSAALSALARFGRAARDYWEESSDAPVYLEWRAVGATYSQFAWVYNLEISAEQDPLNHPDEQAIVTITVEREPAWRAVAPTDNPRIYAFQSRGRTPTVSASPTADQYNYTDVALYAAPAAAADFAYSATLYPFDEVGVTRPNYIEFTPDQIPGDAEALVQIFLQYNATANLNEVKLYLARVTQSDLWPSQNTAANNSRRRMSYSANDWTITSGNPTVTKPTVAYGLLGNGSIVNRSVVRAVFAAGVVTDQTIMTMAKRILQFGKRYAVYMRYRVTAGTANAMQFQCEVSLPNGTGTIELPTVTLAISSPFTDAYLGQLEIPQLKYSTDSLITFRIRTTKLGATTPTIEIYDVLLVPLDEQAVIIDANASAAAAAISLTMFDNTGYLSREETAVGAFNFPSPTVQVLGLTGNGITLVPGVTNRLYIVGQYSSNASPTLSYADTAFTVGVNIVPRWSGARP